jgi:HAE1 family hydrophobic/amphiphilic exporter-1
MTTLTTILALLPMALNRGEGAELFAPISITLFGGLLVSTLLTLIIVPSLYSLIDDIASWAGEKIRN